MRVALADDAAVLREGLARLLADAGVEVTAQVSTAGELLEAVDDQQPDVAVVDIRMPPTWSDEGLAVSAEIHPLPTSWRARCSRSMSKPNTP